MSVTPLIRPQSTSPASDMKFPAHHEAAPPAAAPLSRDRIERSAEPKTAASARHSFGVGLIGGASAEAGAGAGFGATASAGAGLFYDGVRAVHPGAYASGGMFAGAGEHVKKVPQTADGAGVIGAFAGAGVGVFVTNAASASELKGTAQTYSCNVGFGPLKFSVAFGQSDGTYLGAVSVGPGIGLDVSRYPTQSAASR